MTSGCLDRKEVRCATWRVQCEDRPAGGNTGRLFLTFGGPVCANGLVYCPLDRVLIYKNLIYLLNLQVTLVEGYPSRSSEAGGLMMDQFLRPAKSQSKWYGLSSDHKADPAAVSTWYTDACKLNSSYSRIARQSGLASTHPTSRRISQETLRRWEKSAREATVICNQAASFNRCLFKVQQNMQEQLKIVCSDSKGKSSAKVSTAMDEMQYPMNFNSSICQAAAKTMEHLTEFVFISMGNLTLARRPHQVRSQARLWPVCVQRPYTLFTSLIKRAEEEIAHFESKGHTSGTRGKGQYYPYERPEK